LDLEIFISSKAFYNPAFFHQQLKLTRFVFALITNVLKTRSEIDTTGGTPIMLYNALELYFFLIVSGLCNSNIIKKCQDAPNGYHDQKDSDPERLSHLSLLIRSDQNQIILAVYLSGLILLRHLAILRPSSLVKKITLPIAGSNPLGPSAARPQNLWW
jgi:hypothetical protein